jgi:fibronectin-binding autotransporter adhesin
MRDRLVRRSIVVCAALVGATAWGGSTALGQLQNYTYTGAAGQVADWSNAKNWSDPNGKPNAPPVGGANNLLITMGAGTPAAVATTNQDQGKPFVLNTLLYDAKGPAYQINGNPLQFAAAAANGTATITDNADGVISKINVPIVLANNLVLNGAADRTGTGANGKPAEVQLDGVISETPANKGLSVTVSNTGTGSFLLGAANTFTGGVTLQSGGLVIGNNAALGSAKSTFTINGGMVRSGSKINATVPNPVAIKADFQAGEPGINRPLTFGGPATVTGMITINVPGTTVLGLHPTAGSPLVFGGSVTTGAADGLIIMGAAAGNPNPKVNPVGKDVLGGVVRFNGDSSNTFQGALQVASGTVFVNGPMGSKKTPVASVTVDAGARLGGSGGKTFTNITLPAGGMVTMNGTFQPGSSPGIFSLSGNMVFGNQSNFLWQFDGPTAGEGPGNYSQLIMQDGNVTLTSSGGSEPTLITDVLGQTTLPVIGQTYTLIDMEGTSFSRIVGDFMSTSGQDLTQGSIFTDAEGYSWQISYHGGPDDNDVTLTVTGVPEPGTLVLLGIGLAGAAALASRGRRRSAITT